MSDLVERLRQGWGNGDTICEEAATVLEAKEAEIAALRERVKELEGNTPKFQRDGDSYLICEGHHHVNEPCEFERYVPEARAETAERRVADLEEVLADKRRLAREIDIALHGEEGAAKQASLCDLVEPARRLRRELDEARAVLKPFTAYTVKAITVSEEYDYCVHVVCSADRQPMFAHFRAARAVIEKE